MAIFSATFIEHPRTGQFECVTTHRIYVYHSVRMNNKHFFQFSLFVLALCVAGTGVGHFLGVFIHMREVLAMLYFCFSLFILAIFIHSFLVHVSPFAHTLQLLEPSFLCRFVVVTSSFGFRLMELVEHAVAA